MSVEVVRTLASGVPQADISISGACPGKTVGQFSPGITPVNAVLGHFGFGSRVLVAGALAETEALRPDELRDLTASPESLCLPFADAGRDALALIGRSPAGINEAVNNIQQSNLAGNHEKRTAAIIVGAGISALCQTLHRLDEAFGPADKAQSYPYRFTAPPPANSCYWQTNDGLRPLRSVAAHFTREVPERSVLTSQVVLDIVTDGMPYMREHVSIFARTNTGNRWHGATFRIAHRLIPIARPNHRPPARPLHAQFSLPAQTARLLHQLTA